MSVPRTLTAMLEAWRGDAVSGVSSVGGGCISNTTCVVFRSGQRVFLKWAAAREQAPDLFAEEARALRALAATSTVRVPAVLACDRAEGFSWLLLEWLEPGPRTPGSQAKLGEQLAGLHHHSAPTYGWASDNFIGSLPQSNRGHASWADFWREERLRPQIELAGQLLERKDRERLAQLCAAADDILRGTDAEGASLLHGDLWSGNLHTLADGTPALIDPSSYYGHREVDLAMAHLFGGFGAAFFRAYDAAWPCLPGVEQRVYMYQLYYLLVHVNLFGGSYRAQTMSAVAQLGF